MVVVENDSLTVPVCTSRMEISPVRIIFKKFEENLQIDVPSSEKPDVKKCEKSPTKLLIAKYENMKGE